MFGFTEPLVAVRRVPVPSILSVHLAPSSVYVAPKERVMALLHKRAITGAVVSTANEIDAVGLILPKASVSVIEPV